MSISGPQRRRLWPVLIALIALGAAGCAGGHRRPPSTAGPADVAPQEARADADDVEGVLHLVRPGQTLWRIARAYGVSVELLAEANGIEDPTRIEAGRLLIVPGADRVLDAGVYREPSAPTGERSGDGGPHLLWPVSGGDVLSPFGVPRRTHRHTGVDIAGRPGQPVLAAEDGVVVYSGSTMRGYGKTVIVDHGDALTTLYAHNSALLVRVGQRVRRGQTIARIGRSGNATTEHCHFEVRERDVPSNPLAFVSGIGVGGQR